MSSWLLFIAGGFSLGLAIYTFHRRSDSLARLMCLALLAQVWWACLSALSLSMVDPAWKIGLARAAYVGVMSCIPLLLMVSAQASGHGDWICPRTTILVFALPALVLLPASWAFGGGDRAIDHSLFSMQGMAMWPGLIYSFVALSVTAALFLLKWRTAHHPFFRWQAGLVSGGVMSVALASYCVLSGGINLLGSRIIPAAFILSDALLLAAIAGFRLFTIKPLSSEDLLENLADGVVALDESLRVVGFNARGGNRLENPAGAIGKPAQACLTAFPPLAAALDQRGEDGLFIPPQKPILIFFAASDAPLEISLAPVKVRAGRASGYVVKFHELESIKKEITGERQERLLAQSLARAALTFTRTMDVEETLHRILEESAVNVPSTWATLQMIDPQGRAKIICFRGPANPEIARWLRSMRPTVAETAILAWMASTGQPLLIPDLFEPEVDRRSFNLGRSYLGVPLKVADEVVGFINLFHSQPEFYATDHLRTLSNFGELASTILENDRSFQITQELANTDGLTGLNNRRYFFLLAAKEMRRSIRFKKNLSLLMVDLDYFKEINDAFGHQVGDAVLKHLGQLIGDSLRDVDIAGRYGGDEFAILMPETSGQNAEILGNRIREKIRESVFVSETGEVRFTVSLGLASRNESHKIFEDLLEEADRALYQAKRKGRDRLEICPREVEIAI